MRAAAVLVVGSFLVVPGSWLSGQGPAGSSEEAAEPPRFCFRGRPLPACRAFTVTEFTFAKWIGTVPPGENPPPVASELGLMWNLGRAHAIGGSFFVDAGHETLITGCTARYRQWLSSKVGLDVGLGYASPFVVAKGKLSLGDYFGPVIRVEAGSGATYWSAGLELGSAAGAVAIVLATLAGMIAAAACC